MPPIKSNNDQLFVFKNNELYGYIEDNIFYKYCDDIELLYHIQNPIGAYSFSNDRDKIDNERNISDFKKSCAKFPQLLDLYEGIWL